MASVNLLRGRPGAGKGYEGVAYHIIPAVKSGRKVITNMQINIDHFCDVFGEECRALIECRPDRVHGVNNWRYDKDDICYDDDDNDPRFMFSHVDDFDSTWRHPETNQGPLYVIDECHKPFRKGIQLREVEEWFAEVRHTGSNVLLMTQGTRKVNPDILDLVQLTYLVSKVPGDEGSYYRKTIDGLRGQAMNSETRHYESWVYPFYKSHTKSDSAVAEMAAFDVKSIRSHWIFITSKLFLVIGFLVLCYLAYDFFASDDLDPSTVAPANPPKNPLSNDFASLQSTFDTMPVIPDTAVSVAVQQVTMHDQDPRHSDNHPFSGFNISIAGSLRFKDQETYLLSFAQNGQSAFTLSSDQLVAKDYEIEFMGECLVKMVYQEDFDKFITCGYHSQSVTTPLSGGS